MELFFSCGELSGDRNAANLLNALKARDGAFRFAAVGGRNLREAGAEILFDSSQWGSVGWFESAAKFFTVYPAGLQVKAALSKRRPAAFVPVDYRVFNMAIARHAKAKGIPVIYYYAPVSWFGTGGKRFAQMAGCVDLALVTLPFSREQYKAAGIRHEYIGNPLLDTAKPSVSREDAARRFQVSLDRPVVGLMPGSRTSELKRVGPALVGGAEILRRRFPEIQFLLFEADASLRGQLEKLTAAAEGIRIVREGVYDFMNVCDALALCSGTATHEAMVLEKPMVVAYKLSAATAALARMMMDVKFAAMPNILADRFVAPELIQEACTAENVAEEMTKILESPERREKMRADLAEQKAKFGSPGAVGRAASLILDFLKGRGGGEKPNL